MVFIISARTTVGFFFGIYALIPSFNYFFPYAKLPFIGVGFGDKTHVSKNFYI